MKTKRLLVGLVMASVAASVQAVTYTWDGGGADNNWSNVTNWNPDATVLSASNTLVQLNGTTRTTPIQDIANPFVLNRLEFLNTGTTAFTLGGNQLQFVTNGATQPRVYLNRNATCVINNAIDIPAGTTNYMEIGTYGVSFNGIISGGGAIDKQLGAGGIDLRNSANTFSGGLTVRAIDNDWYKVNIYASNAMGTGPVSLYGGSLNTALINPGGLSFFNTTTQTNPISLFQNSPLFTGMPNGGDAVTLNGPVDLNSSTLYLRGGGSGTINGIISEGGANAVTKVDKGTWTLSGANTFTGRLTIVNGAVRLGASDTLNPLVPVSFACATGWSALASATLDLNGYKQTVSQLSGSVSQVGFSNVVASAAPATLTVNQVATSLFDGRLTGALSLVKTGSGSLTLSNSLSAITGSMTVSNGTLVAVLPASLGSSTNVTVAGGTLDLRVGAIADTASLNLFSGGKVALASGLIESVDKLFFNGVQQPSGTYGAAGSGAGTENSAFFDGSGLLLVLSSPPITPADATWDGEGTDTNISTTNNWVGDVLPAFDGTARANFAVGGSTAAVDTAVSLYGMIFNAGTNFALVNGAGNVKIGAGGLFAQVPTASERTYSVAEDLTLGAHQTWNVINNGAGATTLSISGAIDDGLAAYNLTKAGDGVLILSGNSTYDGVTTVKTGGVVRITSGAALGSTNGATIVENGGLLEMSGGINVTESIALYGDASTSYQGVLRSNGGSNIISGLILNGSRIRCNNGSLDLVGGATGGQFVLAATGNTFIRISGKPINIGGSTFYAHTDGLLILDVTNNVWSQLEVSGNILRTDQVNALPPTSMLTLGPSTYGGLNLNGKSQTIGQLVCTHATAGTRIVYSTTPATLTVTQNVNTVFNGSITGAVSVVKMGAGTLTLSNTNTLYGSVVVSNGTLLVNSTGTLGANCTNVVVMAGGTLTLSNSVGIADSASVWMPGAGTSTAKINLAAGVNEAVGWLYLGGSRKSVGTYGATGSGAAIIDNDHFSGLGVLRVLHDKSGTLMRVL